MQMEITQQMTKAEAGETIYAYCGRMVKLARESGRAITCSFNDTSFCVYPSYGPEVPAILTWQRNRAVDKLDAATR